MDFLQSETNRATVDPCNVVVDCSGGLSMTLYFGSEDEKDDVSLALEGALNRNDGIFTFEFTFDDGSTTPTIIIVDRQRRLSQQTLTFEVTMDGYSSPVDFASDEDSAELDSATAVCSDLSDCWWIWLVVAGVVVAVAVVVAVVVVKNRRAKKSDDETSSNEETSEDNADDYNIVEHSTYDCGVMTDDSDKDSAAMEAANEELRHASPDTQQFVMDLANIVEDVDAVHVGGIELTDMSAGADKEQV